MVPPGAGERLPCRRRMSNLENAVSFKAGDSVRKQILSHGVWPLFSRCGRSRTIAGPESRRRCFVAGALLLSALVVLPLVLPRGAFAADGAKGAIIAKRWCAACHLVSPDQKLANPDVPGFAAIARKNPSAKQLKAFLADPHPKMPDMSLTRSEIDDIVAYIGSLGR